LAAIRETLAAADAPATTPAELYKLAREKGLSLRSDASVTTDLLLLAALETADLMAGHGVAAADVEARLAAGTAQHPDVPFALAEEFHVPEPVELLEAARIVDANANRAREGLRVLDDYARFTLNDAVLTAEVKRLRHDLVHAVGELPPGLMQAARDTPGDVGTAVGLTSEYERVTAAQVARVNLARLQESLRSLEEYGKIVSTTFAKRVETIRYAAYTLERGLFSRDPAGKLDAAKLYALLSSAGCSASLEWTIAEAAEGGVDIVQLREKSLPDRDLLAKARDVRRWTRDAGVLFIVNDRPDIAVLSRADGVHLGQEDLTVADARRVVGPDALIGVSTHTAAQVRAAVLDGANYIGVGPTFPSATKDFDHFPGLDFAREVAEMTTVPAFALGGITPLNVAKVVAAGLRRVAVSGAVGQADDPRSAAMRLRSALNR
jgi:thiamine-phosphate pyrophosphorylase